MSDTIKGMIEILLQSLFSVIVLFLLSKLMGFKQISQLNLFDYIVGISIGSIAAQWAIDRDVPVYAAIIAMSVYALIELFISIVTCKSIKLRKFFTGIPIIVIQKGKILEQNLKKVKYDLSDLLTECRINGYFNIADIECAVMETDGRLSFLPKSELRPANPQDLGLSPAKEGLVSNVILDGHIMESTLRFCGKEEAWLLKQLSDQNIKSPQEVLLATVDATDKVTIFKKNEPIPKETPFQ